MALYLSFLPSRIGPKYINIARLITKEAQTKGFMTLRQYAPLVSTAGRGPFSFKKLLQQQMVKCVTPINVEPTDRMRPVISVNREITAAFVITVNHVRAGHLILISQLRVAIIKRVRFNQPCTYYNNRKRANSRWKFRI